MAISEIYVDTEKVYVRHHDYFIPVSTNWTGLNYVAYHYNHTILNN